MAGSGFFSGEENRRWAKIHIRADICSPVVFRARREDRHLICATRLIEAILKVLNKYNPPRDGVVIWKGLSESITRIPVGRVIIVRYICYQGYPDDKPPISVS